MTGGAALAPPAPLPLRLASPLSGSLICPSSSPIWWHVTPHARLIPSPPFWAVLVVFEGHTSHNELQCLLAICFALVQRHLVATWPPRDTTFSTPPDCSAASFRIFISVFVVLFLFCTVGSRLELMRIVPPFGCVDWDATSVEGLVHPLEQSSLYFDLPWWNADYHLFAQKKKTV